MSCFILIMFYSIHIYLNKSVLKKEREIFPSWCANFFIIPQFLQNPGMKQKQKHRQENMCTIHSAGFELITHLFWLNFSHPHTLVGPDPGFFVEVGVDPFWGGFGLQHGHFSVKMCAKMKELGPVGGRVPARPLDPPMPCIVLRLLFSL